METLAEVAARLKRAEAFKNLPRLILMTDPVRLRDPLAAVARLPRGSAVVLRHYGEPDRQRLAARLAHLCRLKGLRLLIGDDPRLGHSVGASGLHLTERALRSAPRRWRRLRRPAWLVTAAAHGPMALLRAARAGADAVLLSPVFPTASHPGARTLGPIRLARWRRLSPLPVYALGGVTAVTARRLAAMDLAGFAAIDALAQGSDQSETP
jgi:thiamine-phosphate pyrophosphorylase